jgi:hypothetical protein
MAETLVDEFHRHFAGDFPGEMPAHPIGYHVEAQRVIGGEIIFVAFSLKTNIGYT